MQPYLARLVARALPLASNPLVPIRTANPEQIDDPFETIARMTQTESVPQTGDPLPPIVPIVPKSTSLVPVTELVPEPILLPKRNIFETPIPNTPDLPEPVNSSPLVPKTILPIVERPRIETEPSTRKEGLLPSLSNTEEAPTEHLPIEPKEEPIRLEQVDRFFERIIDREVIREETILSPMISPLPDSSPPEVNPTTPTLQPKMVQPELVSPPSPTLVIGRIRVDILPSSSPSPVNAPSKTLRRSTTWGGRTTTPSSLRFGLGQM